MNFLFLLLTFHRGAFRSLAFGTVATRRSHTNLLMKQLRSEDERAAGGKTSQETVKDGRVFPPFKSTNKPKVVIVGAGFSGLAVAYHLRDIADCRILEARDRIGGRVHPIVLQDGYVDLGGQWVHEASERNPMVKLLKELNIPMLYASLETDEGTKGSNHRSNKNCLFDTSGQKIPVSIYKSASKFFYKVLDSIDSKSAGVNTSWRDVFDKALLDAVASPQYHRLAGQDSSDPQFRAVINYLIHRVECYEGGRFHELSSHLADVYENLGGPDEIPMGGYNAVLEAVASCIGQSKILLDTPVAAIESYHGEGVRVTCRAGSKIQADYCVCTIPLGVLQKRAIAFQPDLPSERWKAIDCIGMGVLDKVILKFEEAFWGELEVFGVAHEKVAHVQHFYDCSVDFGAPTLVLFLGGDAARRVDAESGLTDEQIADEAVHSLRSIFGNDIPEPTTVIATRWLMDEFSYGSYSFAKVGCTRSAYDEISEPIGNLFFAGEHTSLTAHSCVHGAWATGEREAKRLSRVIRQTASKIPVNT